MNRLFQVLSVFVFGSIVAFAGTSITIDARKIMPTINRIVKQNDVQVTSSIRTVMLQRDVAAQTFNAGVDNITISNFALPSNPNATLQLKRSAPVFDANSQFLINTPNGKKPFKVGPVASYSGTIAEEPGAWVTLHYSNGDLTGFVQHTNGVRTVIAKDYALRETQQTMPHVIGLEKDLTPGADLGNFLCGNDDLPVDLKGVAEAMAITGTRKDYTEHVQGYSLKQLKVAVVLREDIYELLNQRGLTPEQIAQHFVKIYAAMSQAYEEDLGTRLFFEYFLMHTTDAPSGYTNDGLSPGDLLEEFSLDWSSGFKSVDRAVAHLYTRIKPSGSGSFVGGIAYGGQSGVRLCVKSHQGGYGVSTVYLNPGTVIPGNPNIANGFTWDVFVSAHEIGHNIGAAHTHSCYWSPPVDTCQLKRDGTDACYDELSFRKVRPGTIMSYCHLVNGSSVPLIFGTRVSERMRGWIDAASSCSFAITEPRVTITSPRGLETWNAGSTVTILWKTAMVQTVNLDYSSNDGSTWSEVKHGLAASDELYAWKVPAVNAPKLLIRISDANNAAVNNVAPAYYAISLPLSLTSPSGGERLGRKSSFAIRWNKDAGAGSVTVEFAPDGTTWSELAVVPTGTSYSWTVADIETSKARVRVKLTTSPNVVSQSEEFSIGTPRFEWLLPADGIILCKDVENQYNWSGDFIDKIRIQYSTDNGGNWRNAIQSLNVPVTMWQIFSKNSGMLSIPDATPIIMRIYDDATTDVLGTRADMTMGTCTTPTSVSENSTLASVLSIESVTPNPATDRAMIRVSHRENSSVEIFVVDASGRTIQLLNSQTGGSNVSDISVPLDKIASGQYQLVVRSGTDQASASLRIAR
ncbi:MAG: T9SS type A sorting domain-containing protein [Ignavibacteria bacterium]|nr:T9SS type A sorting domain-containing protein [Ignavibacteria bacterium]